MTRQEFIKKLPGLVKNYSPNPEVINRIRNVDLLMVIGPTGVGKTSVIDKLGQHFVPSDTTRVARPGEKEGLDFYFLSNYNRVVAGIKAGEFVQVAVGASGDFYATRPSSYPESGLAVIPAMADVVPIFRRLGFKKNISTFIVPPSYEEWMRRMGSHDLRGQQLRNRLSEARRSLAFALGDKQTHFILNDQLDAAVQQVNQLLKGKIDTGREKLARKTAKVLLDSINL